MAIIMADNFTINLEKSLDDRTYFKTKKAMKDFSINKTTVIGANYIFPITSGSIGYCEETGKHYYFAGRKTDGTITMTVPDAKLEDMGYWKELKLGGGSSCKLTKDLTTNIANGGINADKTKKKDTSRYPFYMLEWRFKWHFHIPILSRHFLFRSFCTFFII